MECGESKSSPEFQVWRRIFGDEETSTVDDEPSSSSGKKKKQKKKKKRVPRRTFREGVMIIAAKLLMGAEGYNDGMDEETGEMSYTFSRPVGGHGKAYVDILHLDEYNR